MEKCRRSTMAHGSAYRKYYLQERFQPPSPPFTKTPNKQETHQKKRKEEELRLKLRTHGGKNIKLSVEIKQGETEINFN